MKKNKKLKMKLMFLSLTAIASISSFFLSSCSATISNPISLKVMTTGSTSKDPIFLDSLKTINKSPKNAILGDKSINNGNYIIIYGSISGAADTLPFRNWLSGGGIENGGGVMINPEIKNNFLNALLNTSELNPHVKVMLFIDNPNFSGGDNVYSKLNYHPFQKYDQTIILEEYNYNFKIENNLPQTAVDEIVEFDKLPDNYQNKENKFIRYDDSAVSYRNFVNYAYSIRPNITPIVGSDFQLSGGIAFSNEKAPATLGEIDINSGSSIETNKIVQSLYKYYLDKDYNK